MRAGSSSRLPSPTIPGQDLGALRRPGIASSSIPTRSSRSIRPRALGETPRRRVLVAGIGNVFLGDDGWGVALAGRLSDRALPRGVDVVDFGIRGMDLAYAMQDDYDAVVLLDATPRGEAARDAVCDRAASSTRSR